MFLVEEDFSILLSNVCQTMFKWSRMNVYFIFYGRYIAYQTVASTKTLYKCIWNVKMWDRDTEGERERKSSYTIDSLMDLNSFLVAFSLVSSIALFLFLLFFFFFSFSHSSHSLSTNSICLNATFCMFLFRLRIFSFSVDNL